MYLCLVSDAHLRLVPGVVGPEERVHEVVCDGEVGEGEGEGSGGQAGQLVAVEVQMPQLPTVAVQVCTGSEERKRPSWNASL